jgi:hypothetical protein
MHVVTMKIIWIFLFNYNVSIGFQCSFRMCIIIIKRTCCWSSKLSPHSIIENMWKLNTNYMQQMSFLQILLLTQHVSGTIMPIIRSSRLLYSWLPPVVFGAWFSSCRYSVELRVVCPVCSPQTGHVKDYTRSKSLQIYWGYIYVIQTLKLT